MTSPEFDIGDRVQYVHKAHYKNLFGTVIESDDGVKWFAAESFYKVEFDSLLGSSLEGLWLPESWLAREPSLEALACCIGGSS